MRLLIAILVALAGCGGSDEPAPEHPHLHCDATPERCK